MAHTHAMTCSLRNSQAEGGVVEAHVHSDVLDNLLHGVPDVTWHERHTISRDASDRKQSPVPASTQLRLAWATATRNSMLSPDITILPYYDMM